MNRLLPILIAVILTSETAKGMSEQRLEITKRCAKVYAEGLAGGIISLRFFYHYDSKPRNTVCSQIRYVICACGIVLGHLIGSPLTYAVDSTNRALRFACTKDLHSPKAQVLCKQAIRRSVPVAIGFGIIPYGIEYFNGRTNSHE